MDNKVKVIGERHCGTNALRKAIETNFNIDIVPSTKNELIRGLVENTEADQNSLAYRLIHQGQVAPDLLMNRLPRWVFGNVDSFRSRYYQYLLKRTYGDSTRRKEQLIDSFFLYSPMPFFWKHGAIRQLQINAIRNVKTVCMIKDPLSWAVSMHRRPYHAWFLKKNISFSQFIRSPWVSTGRENILKYPENIFDLWVIKVRSYIECQRQLLPEKFFILKFEDFLADQLAALNKIASQLDLDISGKNVVAEDPKGSGRSLAEIQDYYFNKRYLNSYTVADLDYAKKQLEVAGDLLEKFKYSF